MTGRLALGRDIDLGDFEFWGLGVHGSMGRREYDVTNAASLSHSSGFYEEH